MSATNFYITGGTLQPGTRSYVERQADKELYEGLLRGEFCYVLTSRQMGKSSLMVHTASRLKQEGVQVVVLDLTAIGQNLSPEQWYGGLLRRLGRQLELEDELDDFWVEHEQLGPLQRWMTALGEVVLPRVSGRIIIFVDEIDAVRSLPFSPDEFFAGIRECYNRRSQDTEFHRVAFCLLGVATPADLISDQRTSPFNIGRRIQLTDFIAEEAAPLAQGLEQRGDPTSGQRLLERVLYWTGGQPYLTQRLCRAVGEDAQARSPADVDRLCDGLFLSRKAREVDDNLAFVRNRLLRSDSDLAGLLDLYRKVQRGKRVKDDETNPLVTILRLSGVVRAAGGLLRPRNRIYAHVFDRDWVIEHTPGAELRRQRAAYRRGVLRATAVAGTVLLIVGMLAFTAVSQAARARRGERKARLETVRANVQAEEARRNGEEARRLAARLQIALLEKEKAYQQLRLSLRAEQVQRSLASQAAQRALVAQQQERAQRLRADAARGEAVHQQQVAVTQRQQAVKARGEAVAQRSRAEQEARGARRNLYFADMNLAPQDWASHNLSRLRQLLEETRDNPEQGFEWAYWQRLCHLDRLTLWGHTRPVRSIAFSPDGRRILTGSGDRTAKVWDAATGRELLTLKGHGAPVWAARFSPDGQWILTGSLDSTARLWDAGTGREILVMRGHRDSVTSAAFSPDGRRIATGAADGTIKIWEAGAGREILTLKRGSYVVWSVAFSPDGQRIVTGSWDGARIWDASAGNVILTLRGVVSPVLSVAFSPDGREIVTASGDPDDPGLVPATDRQRVKVWDATTGRELLTLQGHTNAVFSAVFSPDGKQILTGSADHTAKVWDAATGREILTLWGNASLIFATAFAPDGKTFVTGSADGTARLWDPAAYRESLALRGQASAIRSISFSPDGQRLVTGGRGDNAARVWDAATGSQITALQGHSAPLWAVSFSPDGRRIAAGSLDNTARVWDATTGKPILTLQGHKGWVTSVAFSPDDRRIATGSFDRTAKIWNAGTGRETLSLRGHKDWVYAVAFSPDGRRIATGSQDGTAMVWDAGTGRETLTLSGHGGAVWSAAFSPDGRRLVTGSEDQTAKVWDAATGHELVALKGHTGVVRSVVFSADGRRIITGSLDGTTRMWNAITGRETLALKENAGQVLSVALARNGQRIATGSADSAARVWEAATRQQIAAWTAAERAAQRERRERDAQEAARNALQVVASSTGGAMQLQWQPLPDAVGYQLYRGAAVASRTGLTRLTARPLAASPHREGPVSFTDRGPRLVAGRPLTYEVVPLVKRAGHVVEGRRVALQATPVALPPRWIGSSINEGDRGGAVRFDPKSSEITLQGSGWNIGDAADGCYFAGQPISGNLQVTVQVTAHPTALVPWARAGLMIREGLGAGARHLSLLATAANGLLCQWRSASNSAANSFHGVVPDGELKTPVTLRLTRRGDMVQAEYSLDGGKSFRPAADPYRFQPALAGTVYAGLAITAGGAGDMSEAKFSGLTIQKP